MRHSLLLSLVTNCENTFISTEAFILADCLVVVRDVVFINCRKFVFCDGKITLVCAVNADCRHLLGFCIALYDYEPSETSQLTLRIDDVIVLLSKQHDRVGWWKGTLNGRVCISNVLYYCISVSYNLKHMLTRY